MPPFPALDDASLVTFGIGQICASNAALRDGGVSHFLDLNSGSTLITNGRVLAGDIITDGAIDYNAFITFNDAMFTMNGAKNLRVGDSQFDNVNAELRLSNNGTFNSGIGGGNTIFQRTGQMVLETGGTFHAVTNYCENLVVADCGSITFNGRFDIGGNETVQVLSGGNAQAARTEIGDVGAGDGTLLGPSRKKLQEVSRQCYDLIIGLTIFRTGRNMKC